ncbi:PAS domain S-box protein [Aerosakkonemataceae cyanobacterium BLCC-F154]|uniref:histidine kinase n=1 Tax=Floridaenema fluviatile BLCC-F154 TaxID=3153640 RepID=A0ABV4YI20_9CYAN
MPLPYSLFLPRFPVNSAKISLRWLLVVPFVLQTVGAVALVGYFSYRSGQQAVEKLAHQLMKNVGLQVTQELDRYLQNAHQFNQQQITAIESDAINLENLDRLHRYLILQHRQAEDLTTLLFGTPQGDLRVSHRVSNRDYGVTTQLKPGELPFEAAISKPSNPAINRTYSVNQAGDLGRYLETIKNIDVRDRPWYRQAVKTGKAGWTNPFQISSTNILTLNAYTPFYHKSGQLLGVFAVNISLNQLSDFLHRLEVGKSGKVFIIERNGLLIADSTTEPSYSVSGKPDLSGIAEPGTLKFQRRLPSEIPHPAIQDSYQYLKTRFSNLATIKSPQSLNFQMRDRRYFLTVSPYQDKYGLDWLVVTVIPESDFMAEIQNNRRTTFLLCFLTLAMAIASGLIIANRFTTRIARLNQISQQLASGNLTQRLPANSLIIEVREFAQSFNQMADELEKSFDRLHNSLEQSEEKFTTVFRNSPQPAWTATLAEGRCIDVNESFSKVLGYSRTEAIGKTCVEMQLWTDLADLQHFRASLLQEGKIDNFEVEFRTKSGEIKTVLLFAKVTRLDEQDCVIGVLNDISDRKQLELARERSEAQTQTILNTTMAAIASMRVFENGTWEVDRVSAGCELISGYTSEELVQDKNLWLNLIEPEDWQLVCSEVFTKIFAEQTHTYEYRLRHKDGSQRWISETNNSWWDQTQKCWVLTAISIDITARKQAEIALQASETRFRTVVEYAPDVLVIYDRTLRFQYVNEHALKRTGWTLETFIGKRDEDLFPPEVTSTYLPILRKTVETRTFQSGEATIQLPGQEPYTMLVKYVPILDRQGEIQQIFGITTDITERKQAEEALRLSEERWQLAIAGANDGIWDHNLITNEIFFSPRCLEMLGCSCKEIKTFDKWTERIHPDDRLIVQNTFEKYLNQQNLQYVAEYRICCHDGSYKWILSRGKAVWNEQGIPFRMVGSITDITDRRHLEAIKDEFVSVVSHELRTPLTSLRGSLGILETGILKNKPDKVQQMLEIAVNNTDRLVRLVNDILDFQRLQSPKLPLVKEIFQVNDLIEQAVESVQAIANQANLTLKSTPLNASVLVSGDEIIQTLINLLGNAIKFSFPGGTIWVKAEVTNNLDRRILAKFPDLEHSFSTNYILFSITDQGRGIPPEKLESIFGCFQQVDSSDSRQKGGTGLGLAICKNIVQRHQGLIWAESAIGQGSTFYFTLPIADELLA